MHNPSVGRDPGFLVIGAMKLASAVLLAAAGLGAFRLLHQDLGLVMERIALRLHLDPDDRIVREVASRVSVLGPKRLAEIGVGTFFYAILHAVEGTGLLLRRRWASYLTVVITGSLLPLELYEVARKVTALRVAVLVVNLGILAYLVIKLREEHGRRAPRARSLLRDDELVRRPFERPARLGAPEHDLLDLAPVRSPCR